MSVVLTTFLIFNIVVVYAVMLVYKLGLCTSYRALLDLSLCEPVQGSLYVMCVLYCYLTLVC